MSMELNISELQLKQLSIARRNSHLTEPPDIIEETTVGAVVTTYAGYAGVGATTTAIAAWLVIKIVETTGASVTTIKQYANGQLKKDQKWDDRASLTYAYLQKGSQSWEARDIE